MADYKHSPLKVLVTADTVGGVWTYCVELCKALQSFNVSFYLLTAGAKMQDWQRQQIADLDNVEVIETEFLLEWMENPWEDIDASGKYLLQLEQEFQPDILHLNLFSYGSLPFKAPIVLVAHSDIYTWWHAVKKENPPAQYREYFLRVQDGIRNANIIIAPSREMMKSIKENYFNTNNQQVIYNARKEDLFYKAFKEPYILSMGRLWDEGKNLKLLIDAAPKINFEIRIAGSNQLSGNNIELGNNIKYLGNISTHDVAAQLSTASVYVLPAKYEPFGLSALEAALSGCALVLGDIPSLREIWQDNAVFIDTDDASALAIAINQLMQNQQMLKQYADMAFTHAKQFSTCTMSKQYLHVYHQLLKQKTLQKTELA